MQETIYKCDRCSKVIVHNTVKQSSRKDACLNPLLTFDAFGVHKYYRDQYVDFCDDCNSKFEGMMTELIQILNDRYVKFINMG